MASPPAPWDSSSSPSSHNSLPLIPRSPSGSSKEQPFVSHSHRPQWSIRSLRTRHCNVMRVRLPRVPTALTSRTVRGRQRWRRKRRKNIRNLRRARHWDSSGPQGSSDGLLVPYSVRHASPTFPSLIHSPSHPFHNPPFNLPYIIRRTRSSYISQPTETHIFLFLASSLHFNFWPALSFSLC